MPVVVLMGTLDTKGPELLYLRDRTRAAGCEVVLVDCGVRSTSPEADVSADEVAAAAGADRAVLVEASDRGPAVMAMARGATEIVEAAPRVGTARRHRGGGWLRWFVDHRRGHAGPAGGRAQAAGLDHGLR